MGGRRDRGLQPTIPLCKKAKQNVALETRLGSKPARKAGLGKRVIML